MAAMAMNELGPMLTASEVAELLHLHVNTVKRLGIVASCLLPRASAATGASASTT
jgi:hypothetical protein